MENYSNDNNNSKIAHVIGSLVSSYNVSGEKVEQMDYICVYEYEYNGEKYKYTMHKKMDFEPIQEQLDLYILKKNPSKAFRKNEVNRVQASKIPLVVTIVVMVLIILLIFNNLNLEIDLTGFIILVPFILIIFLLTKNDKKKRENKDNNIIEAIENNRVVTATRKKYWQYNWVNYDNGWFQNLVKSTPYKTWYKYEFNGKKYTTVLWFADFPPSTIKLYLGDNPKDVIKYTS